MPATAKYSPPPASATAGFVPIGASLLRCLDTSDMDFFLWNDRAGRVVLFRDATLEISDDCLSRLECECYVRACDYAGVCDQLLANLETTMADESLTPGERFEVLQTAVSREIEKSLQSIDPSEYMALVNRVGGVISTLVSDNVVVPGDLFAIARHDAATFSHVTNVAGYAVVLAEELGITDASALDQIAVGAMLHDIGKRYVPQQILSKPRGLTAEERQRMALHPQQGYEELCHRGDVNFAQLMMVYQHHERVDGQGYPVRVPREEIHPWARLLAVVDVFDALTGKRPYRRPMSLGGAIKFLADRKGTHFDEEMVTCWISLIKTT